ncbi:hypothetical protein DENIS_4158 [Desulfonema ishimotonii]|uniref:Uncharacterized protein n=1 Tax=Desulfonema ishimotonii TaxID=45657 RepID=A0A401G1U0_9BACT|nr:hypothetical protein DENIS_4158 [Desulfonema ishimotonii]
MSFRPKGEILRFPTSVRNDKIADCGGAEYICEKAVIPSVISLSEPEAQKERQTDQGQAKEKMGIHFFLLISVPADTEQAELRFPVIGGRSFRFCPTYIIA